MTNRVIRVGAEQFGTHQRSPLEPGNFYEMVPRRWRHGPATYDGVNIYCVRGLHAIGLKVALSGLGRQMNLRRYPFFNSGACWRDRSSRTTPSHTLAAQ